MPIILPRNREELSTFTLVKFPAGSIARQSVNVPPVSILIFQTGLFEVFKFRSLAQKSYLIAKLLCIMYKTSNKSTVSRKEGEVLSKEREDFANFAYSFFALRE